MSANKILLPVASPLFVPFYLAKTLNFNRFDDIKFEYPKLPHGENHIDDPLVKELYKREDCLLAVGDPMRFFRSGYHTLENNKPFVIASLIKKMYYWTIVMEEATEKDTDQGIHFVHPKGMAGYAVVEHHLKAKIKDQVTFNDLLKDDGIPGFEKYACEKYKALLNKYSF